mmetsp:Transcript_47469/g.110737  ORF Transcript_47469/g.110737 Transcript_47469/m.110737 type:complete len:369 (-) Transcript_47469:357-1463(-)
MWFILALLAASGASVRALSSSLEDFHAVSACAWGRRNTQYTPTHCIANRPSKLMICSAAKAGKTTVVAMMFAHTNKTQDAVRWLKSKRMASEQGTTWLRYEKDVFNMQPEHAMPEHPIAACSSGGGWLCIMLVRDPLDRALSSFFYTAKSHFCGKWQALAEVVGGAAAAEVGNYTLKQHVRAMVVDQQALQRTHPFASTRNHNWKEHVMPQFSTLLEDLFARLRPAPKQPGDIARDSLQGDVWRAAFGERASPFKLVTVENLASDLMAMDDEFRNGKLGLGSLARGLHSSHWQTKRALATTELVAAASVGAALGPRSRRTSAEANTFVSALCGYPAGFPVPRRYLIGTKACRLSPGTYGKLLAANAGL